MELKAPAKLNLFLELMGRRSDGYHEIATVMQEIDLADTLEARPAEGFSLEVSGLEIPPGGENLVLKAARLLAQAAGLKLGAAFRLRKRIPAGAGLGGGSSDAAAALKACARLWGLDASALPEVAAQVGSDVPYFLTGGTALCAGRGERVEALPPAPSMSFLLVWPGLPLSTRDVYEAHARLADASPRKEWREFLRVLEKGDPEALGAALFNRLEPAALSVRPGLKAVREALSGEAFHGTLMSGSGSSFFGLSNERWPAPDVLSVRNRIGWKLFRTKTPSFALPSP